jgi:DNA-binding NarL/FixJ family response regulator
MERENVIRVFVADDHHVIRDGLQRILGAEEDLEFAGAAVSGDEVIERAADAEWDVLVLDVKLEGKNGVKVVEALSEERPDIPIVIFSMYDAAQYGTSLLQAGAKAFIHKGEQTSELLRAIRRAHEGKRTISDAIAERLLDVRTGYGSAGAQLSERELEILGLLASGHRTKEIAAKLYISPSTVSTHIANTKEKLQCESIAELIRYALQKGLA